MELERIVASFLHFFLACGSVKFFNELADFLRCHWELRNFLCHCLAKSQAPFVNNKTPCNKPVGNVSNSGTTYVTKIGPRIAQVYTLDFVVLSFIHLLVFLPYRSVVKFDFWGNLAILSQF